VSRVLILLPPSEGKSAPIRGPALDLDRLSFPELNDRRARMLDELGALCSGDVEKAADVLGLGPRQHGEVTRNAALRDAPTAPAARVYTGVLYAALDHQTLHGTALRRVNRWVAVQSALFGLVRLGDRIPAYRLSADVALPGLGKVSSAWREHIRSVLPPAAGTGLVVDMRSAAYAAFWKPGPGTVTVRVLHEVDGRRKVVSHANKATKGRVVRALAEDGATPRAAGELAEHLCGLGWHAETAGAGRVDVVVTEV
jgi:cytoplasmic iron level regulating protein YaaA (DUF328/UPF0246 family)